MAEYHTIDLGRLTLKAGEARRLDLALPDEQLSLGGQTYTVSHPDKARVDISRTLSGYALRLRFRATLAGPCMRCLTDSSFGFEIESREIDQPADADEELMSPYVDMDVLDVGAWAHDALMLELPQTLLCREDCLGLCPVCGVALNDAGPDHTHEAEPDPRWAKLREIELD